MTRGEKAAWWFIAAVVVFILATIARAIATRNVPAPW